MKNWKFLSCPIIINAFVEKFNDPFIAAVIPEVPDASNGILGLFNQMSEPFFIKAERDSSYPVKIVAFLNLLMKFGQIFLALNFNFIIRFEGPHSLRSTAVACVEHPDCQLIK